MQHSNMKKISAIILSLLPLFGVFAQNDKDGYNESVIVVGDYKPVVEKSVKINVAPTITDTMETIRHNFAYSITPQRVTSIFNPTRIGYVKITEPPTRLYNNYLRLGFGNYWTPMADFYYHSTRSQTTNYGLHLYHRSSWGKLEGIGKYKQVEPDPTKNNFGLSPDYYGPNHFSNTDVSFFYKYIIKDAAQFSTDLAYSNDYSMFYGFSDSTLHSVMGLPIDSANAVPYTHDSVDKSKYGMMYNCLRWNLGLRSIKTDVNQLGYEANVNVVDLMGRYGLNELNVGANGTVHYGFPMFAQYKGIAYLRFAWDGYLQNYTPQQQDSALRMPFGYVPATADTAKAVRNLLSLNPYMDFIFNGFQFHAGVRIVGDAYTDADSLKLKFYPDVMISKSFMNEDMNISLGATGGVEANSWNAIRLVNPYVGPGADVRATKHLDLFGHLRFNFSKKLEFNARVEYTFYKDALLFWLDSNYSLHNVFTPYYRDYNRTMVGADLAFVNDEMLTLRIGGHYYLYSDKQKDLLPLLYLPDFDAGITAKVNYKDKVLVHLQGLLIGNMYSQCEPTTSGYSLTEKLPMRTGLNMEVEYIHNRALSFFVKFDNILFQRYYYWANYPSQRFVGMLGLTYTIPTQKH